jgi:hypothetical protein
VGSRAGLDTFERRKSSSFCQEQSHKSISSFPLVTISARHYLIAFLLIIPKVLILNFGTDFIVPHSLSRKCWNNTLK